jgi:hypothetical protein
MSRDACYCRFFARRAHADASQLLSLLERPDLRGDQIPAEPGAARHLLIEVQQLRAPSVEDTADPIDSITRLDMLRDYWPTWARLLVEGR